MYHISFIVLPSQIAAFSFHTLSPRTQCESATHTMFSTPVFRLLQRSMLGLRPQSCKGFPGKSPSTDSQDKVSFFFLMYMSLENTLLYTLPHKYAKNPTPLINNANHLLYLFQRLDPSKSPFPTFASVVRPPNRSFSSVTEVCFVKYGEGSLTKIARIHAITPKGIDASQVILKASL